MQKIVFVAHCILNTASKVIQYNQVEINEEENLRLKFLNKAVSNGVQMIQLPCPELLMYGSNRWGHVKDQFDNPFFRKKCREILEPFIEQMREYLSHPDRFEVLGVIGIDGSPSCGVDYTCTGDWFGSFGGRENLQETILDCHLVKENGILMDVFKEMLKEEGMDKKIKFVGLFAHEENKCLSLIG